MRHMWWKVTNLSVSCLLKYLLYLYRPQFSAITFRKGENKFVDATIVLPCSNIAHVNADELLYRALNCTVFVILQVQLQYACTCLPSFRWILMQWLNPANNKRHIVSLL